MKYFVFVFFSLVSISIGQSAFWEFNTSRYARVVSLGNAFTGLADDIESVYYNSAGLANLDDYKIAYSKGNGYAFVINNYTADSYAVLVPTFDELGKFALSVDRLNFEDMDSGYSLYRLHFARNILNNLSVGASINYYHLYADSYSTVEFPGGNDEELSANSFDMSLSALYSLPTTSFWGISNETRFGFQIQNIFSTKMKYSGEFDSYPKHQTLRLGVSTSIIPELKNIANLIPLKLIVVADAVFYGSEYEFNVWQPNFGIELNILEILSFRFGRENEKVIKDAYDYSPQHPVKRYGIGLRLPLHKLISDYNKVELSLDYSYSDWDKLDETKPMMSFISNDSPIRESFSLKFAFQY